MSKQRGKVTQHFGVGGAFGAQSFALLRRCQGGAYRIHVGAGGAVGHRSGRGGRRAAAERRIRLRVARVLRGVLGESGRRKISLFISQQQQLLPKAFWRIGFSRKLRER